MSVTEEHSAALPAYSGHPFSWRFATPLFVGSALNPINSSLIATALPVFIRSASGFTLVVKRI
ncbi:hypothetical protein [Streptomyces colonosanans]|uniref:hypothetical protein n=1 Tax=Streptomyces colonosanans TaxID=1428652 RepID=UPI0009A0DFE5|nr:hypothetical protein [Streptomyces colonosanans]